jgi:(2Fe-2S) ferredoxin
MFYPIISFLFYRKIQIKTKSSCLYLGGHRFAGNVIVYPSGTWYGRVSTCHIPLIIDAYTSSSSEDLKEKLKPLLRGYLDTT